MFNILRFYFTDGLLVDLVGADELVVELDGFEVVSLLELVIGQLHIVRLH